jgi:hypothetical protein
MKTAINGTEYDVFGPINATFNIDDTLDSCIFYIKDPSLSFEKWDVITFPYDNEVKTFSLFEYENSTEKGYTQITGIEPTRIIDEIWIDGYAQSNIYDATTAFYLLRSKLNQRILHTGFYLSGPSQIPFTGSSEELVMGGLHTVREILDAFLSTWDRAVRVSSFNPITKEIALSIDDPNTVGNNIEIKPYYVNSAKGEDIANGIVSDAKNVVVANSVKENWRKPTSNAVLFNTDGAIIETLAPIYRINSFKIGFPNMFWAFDVIYYNGSSWISTTVYISKSLAFDLTDYCVDFDYYKTLDYEESFKYCYYERGNRGIKHLLAINDTGILVDESTYQLMLLDKFTMPSVDESENEVYSELASQIEASEITSQIPSFVYNDKNGAFPTFGLIISSISSLDISPAIPQAVPSWKNAIFKSEYQTTADLLISVGAKGTSLLDNQTEAKIQDAKYVSLLKSKKNRLGNREITLDRNGTDVYSINDRYGDYVLDNVTVGIRENNISQHYHFTKNYNALNESVKLNKELRVYEIPTEGYIKSVLEYDGSSLADYANGFSNVDGILVSTAGGYVFIPKIDSSNMMTFRFEDNYSAVSYLTYDETINIIRRYVTNYASYVDENGNLLYNVVRLVKRNAEFSSAVYPYESLGDFTVLGSFELNYSKDPFEQIEISINKER